MKRCCRCGQVKPFEDFGKNKTRKDGLSAECKLCKSKIDKSSYSKNIQRAKTWQKEYSAKNSSVIVSRIRRWRSENRYKATASTQSFRRRNPEKYLAHNAVTLALRNGLLVKQPCEICGVIKGVEAHHEDYSKPLEVTWLCKKHHIELHVKRMKQNDNQNS